MKVGPFEINVEVMEDINEDTASLNEFEREEIASLIVEIEDSLDSIENIGVSKEGEEALASIRKELQVLIPESDK